MIEATWHRVSFLIRTGALETNALMFPDMDGIQSSTPERKGQCICQGAIGDMLQTPLTGFAAQEIRQFKKYPTMQLFMEFQSILRQRRH